MLCIPQLAVGLWPVPGDLEQAGLGLSGELEECLVGNARKCIGCGHCAIGCPTGAKWDTRELLNQAVKAGAELITGCTVQKLIVENNRVTGVQTKQGKTYHADVVIAAAGGMGTPEILENSGIPCQETFFVDPVLCVAAPLPGYHQEHQLLMPFIS